jgi:hypothetical protein
LRAGEYNERVNVTCPAWLLASMLVAAVGCSGKGAWVATGSRSAFPSPLSVANATAITIDATYIYWIASDGFLYRAPRSSGDVDRVPLPAPGKLLGAHNDVFVGWTDGSGNAAVADIDPPAGTVTAVNHQPGALVGMVAGQHGYSFAVAAPDGTQVETCLNGVCQPLQGIKSDFKSLALDLPTKTYYVLTADGLRTCTVSGGCPAQAAATPAATSLIAALPGTYFLLDANGQAFAAGGAPRLGSLAVPGPTKLVVVDGNGHTPSPVGTWSNGAQLAQTLLAPGATTTGLAAACTDFEVDATGRPIYCLVGSSTIQVIP